ncbi:hypothetical protein IMG5_105990 [Ichthyophthirius multifiliis]|uniref:RRM domain-containing protein n=1 Tax=Ichthyophthirius multifiliis TaxID=5932 RepID=G0QT42_ICHMU|nr:hypothetical protein IMG5_105990 [Ichthyophthirius multifiliis]EGR31617.1 hypothetical protein IMG5_105990 [Ichthyophthirius multifiliis]|eukprot:XP_004035103.1 hypothetical protein IMG5_105990 [Ichthyophthirius multifiliis]
MSRKNPRTTEEDLDYEFKKFGKITYRDYHDAEAAIKKMNKAQVDGKVLIVEPAGQKVSRSRGPQPVDRCYNCGRRGHWSEIIIQNNYL